MLINKDASVRKIRKETMWRVEQHAIDRIL